MLPELIRRSTRQIKRERIRTIAALSCATGHFEIQIIIHRQEQGDKY
jgi:hypothetical protein